MTYIESETSILRPQHQDEEQRQKNRTKNQLSTTECEVCVSFVYTNLPVTKQLDMPVICH